jgi:DNA-directed RNA polymerase beta subunit
MEVLEPTDRDSYRNKRVAAAGTSVAKSFKSNFNIAIAQEVRKQLTKEFKNTPFSQVPLAEAVKSAINSDDLERLLTQSIVNGNKTITIKRIEMTNRLSSQTLYHKNDMNVKSTLNSINAANSNSNKQNERADEMRRVHPTYLGYIDISQSADTGEKVGMTKQLACTASVCGASSSFNLKAKLRADPDIMDLDNITPSQITEQELAKVFVNGDWVGCCRRSHELARKYRNKRRHDAIHHLTTIVWEPLIREVYFWTDVGRLMRPLVIVYNNLEEYVDNWRNGDRSIKFHQWVKLTKQHIVGLQNGTTSMDDLRKSRVIEYISPEEQESALVANNIDVLRGHEHDLQRMYTHCDVDQAIFGIVTLAAPLANHSNAVRNTMYTNHRKQSAGWFALNYPYRIDKNTTLQWYCERPIISVIADALTYPNGHNCIVALALHGGELLPQCV